MPRRPEMGPKDILVHSKASITHALYFSNTKKYPQRKADHCILEISRDTVCSLPKVLPGILLQILTC